MKPRRVTLKNSSYSALSRVSFPFFPSLSFIFVFRNASYRFLVAWMDFIKRFHFIQKFKNNSNHKNNATSLGRQKSKRSIFSHHNNDRLVSSNARNMDSDDEEQDDDDDDSEYNNNTLIFRQKPLHAITITNKPKTLDTNSKSKSARPTHQLYMQHQQKNSSSTVEGQLLSLSSSDDVQRHKQLSIAFEGKGTKYPSRQQEKRLLEEHHHRQEKSAMRHPEKVSVCASHVGMTKCTHQRPLLDNVSLFGGPQSHI